MQHTQLIDYERIGHYNVQLSENEDTGHYYAMLDNMKPDVGEHKRVNFFESARYERARQAYADFIDWARNELLL